MMFKKILWLVIVTITTASMAKAQQNINILTLDALIYHPLKGVEVKINELGLKLFTYSLGVVKLKNLQGKNTFLISYNFNGYQTRMDTLKMPTQQESLVVLLNPAKPIEELEEVRVSSTRSSRTIEDIPTRVEVIAGEELDEKGNMKPGDIRMLLNESTGIQTQQTSAISANSSIRIQGLDGKYTQILRDGFPLYSGFSGGLGLLQIAPLDLKRVEVLKGSASTLYGGGAIAGLVNLISRTPEEEKRLDLLLNGTSALGLDASAFYSEKF